MQKNQQFQFCHLCRSLYWQMLHGVPRYPSVATYRAAVVVVVAQSGADGASFGATAHPVVAVLQVQLLQPS